MENPYEIKFDTVVIGKGLVGSAAAKYLSLANEKIAVIGPDEPTNPETSIVFASHYDEGRVQRQIGRNDVMTQLNADAHKHYLWLEKESGMSFQGKAGCLYVNPRGKDAYLDAAPKRIAKYGTKATFYRGALELKKAFPEFEFPDGSAGMFEDSPSGHINPRCLIKAQLAVTEKNGGSIIRECVRGLDYQDDEVVVTTHEGSVVKAKRVLLTLGAFTNLANLLKRRLALTIKSEVVILARLSLEEGERLKNLPSLLYEIDVPELEGIYFTRPLRYPDGHCYLKMGCNLPEDIFFENSLKAVQSWFRSGHSDVHIEKMLAALKKIMPNLRVEDCISKRCILTRTYKHENPYIGRINDQSYVAIGQGWGGSTSDSIGSVVSYLMLNNHFPEGYTAEAFEPVFLD